MRVVHAEAHVHDHVVCKQVEPARRAPQHRQRHELKVGEAVAREEDALLRLVASLLGVNDLDSNMARRKAAGE